MKKCFILFLLIMSISVCFTSLLQKENKIKEYSIKENIELAIYLKDEQTNYIPSKESGYYYDRERSSCTNDAYINWDSVSWSPVVNNMSEYKTRCELYFTTTYTEGILNGTDPVLKDGLVPVTIEENGTVKKANLESEWYSYANKKWANSVILDDQYDTLNSQGNVYGATKENGYVSFDGVDDYIDLGLENYEFSNGVTLAITFSMNELSGSSYNRLIGNWENAGIGLHVLSSGKIRFDVHDGSIYQNVNSENPINLGETYTAIGTYDGKSIKLFLNSELVKNLDIELKISASVKPFSLAANLNTTIHEDFANVNVENVQIYNRAISEEEVSLVSEGKVANSEGLLRYVDFTNKSYEDNEIIPEEKIESYFVWIPKYRYQLWDLGSYDSLTTIDESKVHEIPIIFGDYNTLDAKEGECTTPMESGKTGNCEVGYYMTHPAFISIPSIGFWVGKFETGYNGATSIAEAQQNVNDSSKVIIKPNAYSWRGIQVANAFYSSYNYQRNLDSHMMKNTEWGAVAYLQHSAYGSATSVRINNNSDFLTGYQANNEPTCGNTGTNEECNRYCNDNSCNTAYPSSSLASTTNNITGIFDMNGGSFEYMMNASVNLDGKLLSGRNSMYNSGFNGKFSCPTCAGDTSGLTELTDGYDWPISKYYDMYSYSNSNLNFDQRILGDATGEMGPFFITNSSNMYMNSWYLNQGRFISETSPTFYRSLQYNRGTDAGIFSFTYGWGYANTADSFRIILTPLK